MAEEDPKALQEAIEFFEISDADLPKLLSDPFERKPILDGKPYWESRFSDGDFPVFYAAREQSTASAEYAYHAPRRYSSAMGTFRLRLHLISCRIIAVTRDLTGLTEKYPDLVADSHDFCHEVGAATKEQGGEGLLATSVRCSGGKNAAILEQDRVSEAAKIRDVIFEVDAVQQTAVVISEDD